MEGEDKIQEVQLLDDDKIEELEEKENKKEEEKKEEEEKELGLMFRGKRKRNKALVIMTIYLLFTLLIL